MQTDETIKQAVRERYGKIAVQSDSGCGCGCEPVDETAFSEDYSQLQGYAADADLGLGCGLPTEFAQIHAGDIVLDLGSGAGNDCFVARSMVGEKGKVIGVDMTDDMILKARHNAVQLGYSNVEFKLGEIEALPLSDNSVDVVVSNCVMNLVSDKKKAFAETFRVLKSKGHFSISDIVINGDLPKRIQEDLSLYVGCVSGAISHESYLQTIREAGFTKIRVQKERKISLSAAQLAKFLTPDEIEEHNRGEFGASSITVYAEKS